MLRKRRGAHLKIKLLSETSYEAGSGGKERRVVYKAEVLEKGTNTRFVVTNRREAPQTLYDRYIEQGETENQIKD